MNRRSFLKGVFATSVAMTTSLPVVAIKAVINNPIAYTSESIRTKAALELGKWLTETIEENIIRALCGLK